MLRHVVLMQFAAATTQAHIDEVGTGLESLVLRLPGAISVSAGANVSPEGLDRGFKHGFVMDFDSAGARDTYLEHPDHVSFAEEMVIPALAEGYDSIVVFDYEVSPARMELQ